MKKTVTVCDRCKKETTAAHIEFIVGRSFQGADYDNDVERLDLCVECLGNCFKAILKKAGHDEAQALYEACKGECQFPTLDMRK